MAKRLLVVKGPDKGKAFVLNDSATTLLGRSRKADGRLSDPHASRIHCEIEPIKGGRWLLTDLESDGTFVNGQRIEETLLRIGDVLRIGDTELRLEEVAAVPVPVPAVALARPVPMTPAHLHELSGARVSHYEIGPLLARGESGLVFQAQDFKNNRQVAFKVLWPDAARDEEEIRRFVRAMKTTLRLRHPHLVKIHGAGKTGPYCWIAMELVEGDSLAEVMKRLNTGGKLDWRKTLPLTVYLARGLAYLHGNNVIHRNLTPTNVLIGKKPEDTKLGDLVLAKATEGALAMQITKPGEILGDVRYLSPERVKDGAAAADGRSDLYSLGALTYGLLTGRPPFEGANVIDTLLKIRQAEPVPLKKYQPDIPDAVEAVVLKLLAKRPDKRYQTAGDLLKALGDLAKTHGVKL